MRFRRLFRPLPRSARDLDAELREEIESHVAMCADALEQKGMSRAAALAAARSRFGDFEDSMRILRQSVRQRSARVHRRELAHTIRQDLAFAWRQARRSPAFSVAVVTTLALGIGANAAMFGLVDRLLLRQPPGVVAPDDVRRLYWSQTFSWAGTITQEVSNYADYLLLRQEARSWTDIAAHFSGQWTYGRGEGARPVRGAMVTASYWSLLRPRMFLGRFFTADEDVPGTGAPVAVVSHDFWRTTLGADSAVLGRRIVFNGLELSVVGVAAPGFHGIDLQDAHIWMPMSAGGPVAVSDQWQTRSVTWLRILGRLRPGVSEEEAAAEATGLFRRALLAREHEGGRTTATLETIDPTARVLPASLIEARGPSGWLLRTARIARWLSIMALLVLAIAAANVANLLLARASTRVREIAVRSALGASGRRLAALLLTESGLYAAAGTLAGLVIAALVSRSVHRLLLPDVATTPLLVGGGRNVLLASLTVMVMVAVLTSLTPIVLSRRASIVGALKAGARGATLARSRTRLVLIVVQGALSLVLLSGAGLFVRSLHRAMTTDVGFDAAHVVVSWFESTGAALTPAQRDEHYAHLIERMRGQPNVARVALATSVPFWSSMSRRIRTMDRDSIPSSKDGGPYVTEVSSEYFATLGTRIVRGRAFNDADRAGAPLVAILSETIAHALFGDRDALGQCVRVGPRTAPCTTVVGIAQDARRQALEEPDPILQYYLPLAQRVGPGSAPVLFVRARDEASTLVEALRREFVALGPSVPYASVRVLQELVDPQIQPWRLGASMFAAFGLLALIIAAVGLYSVLAYEVARRRPEFGVRMALGARTADIMRLVLSQGAALTIIGVALGLGGAALGARFLQPLLFETSVSDPAIYGGVIAVLLGAAIAASVPAALRARRVDPNSVLRME